MSSGSSLDSSVKTNINIRKFREKSHYSFRRIVVDENDLESGKYSEICLDLCDVYVSTIYGSRIF